MKESKSEQTRKRILTAAEQLFAERGYESVSIREIAKSAGCSHTNIYMHFKDKSELLYHLSSPPLRWLQKEMESVLRNEALSSTEKMKALGRVFIHFCLSKRNMYFVFFMAEPSRVDAAESELEIQKLRNELFRLLRRAVQEALQLHGDDERVLAYSRIFFYTLHGIIGTYVNSAEPLDALRQRLDATFNLALDVVLAGFLQTMAEGRETDEN